MITMIVQLTSDLLLQFTCEIMERETAELPRAGIVERAWDSNSQFSLSPANLGDSSHLSGPQFPYLLQKLHDH